MVGFQLNTKVLMADNTYKNIQDIQINDNVMSWDENNQCLVPQTVVNTFSETCNELTIYTFDNGDVLYGCENLVFLTADGWKENIEIGDLVITKSGLPTALVDEEVLGSETVYELNIEDIDNYIVENIVVHNAIFSFFIYDVDGNRTGNFTKSSNAGVIFNIGSSGTIDVAGYGTYTPTTTIDGYSSTVGGAVSYSLDNTYTWTSSISLYEHNTAPSYNFSILATETPPTNMWLWYGTNSSNINTYIGQLGTSPLSISNYAYTTVYVGVSAAPVQFIPISEQSVSHFGP